MYAPGIIFIVKSLHEISFNAPVSERLFLRQHAGGQQLNQDRGCMVKV